MSNLPKHAAWKHIVAVALLGGGELTMSLFISGLAFRDPIFIEQAILLRMAVGLKAGEKSLKSQI